MPSPLTPTRVRPISYSEGDVYMLRSLDIQTPLVVNKEPSIQPYDWCESIHSVAIRFSLHITLISLFENVFFWNYISTFEDTALIGLVNNYAQGFLTTCPDLTPVQRIHLKELVDLFLNQTVVDHAGSDAFVVRNNLDQRAF